jgi:hypothetical protein
MALEVKHAQSRDGPRLGLDDRIQLSSTGAQWREIVSPGAEMDRYPFVSVGPV